MADRTFMADQDLEAALRDLGQNVDYPATPELWVAVRVRLAQPVRRRGWFAAPWRRALAVALVAIVVLLGAGLAISPEARDAVAQRLGLKSVTIEHVPEPAPSSLGTSLSLGQRTTLDEARAQIGFAILVPSDLGAPDAVYVTNPNQVSLIYRARADLPATPQAGGIGVLLSEFRARIDTQVLFGKGVPPNAHLEEVKVASNRAFWISGAPHTFFYVDPNGQMHDDRNRLAGDTLLWEQNNLTVRLESALERDAAIRLAESLR